MGSRGAPSPRRIECRCQTGSRSRRKAARARTAAMTGAPDLDAMTAEEFVAYLDDLDRAEKPRTPEQTWREAYREEQQQKRVVGTQHDLSGGDTRTPFRGYRHPPGFNSPALEQLEPKPTRTHSDQPD